MNVDIKRVGRAITYLRKQSGYTQKELATIIGISDKAVSKWERGLSLPDIAYITKLAAILDTDSEELLSGDIYHHENSWEGLLLLGDKGGVNLFTQIFGKPLVYHILSFFLLAGISDILIATDEEANINKAEVLAETEKLNISVRYTRKDLPSIQKAYINSEASNLMVITDFVFLYGVNLTRLFRKVMNQNTLPLVLSANYLAAADMPSIFFDNARQLVQADDSNRVLTQYDYSELPILFCSKKQFSALYSADSHSVRLAEFPQGVYTEPLGRGYFVTLIHTQDDVLELSSFIKVVEKNTRHQLCSIEEIAWRRGQISLDELEQLAIQKNNLYEQHYLLEICARARKNRVRR